MGEKFPEKDCKDSSTVKSQKRKSKVVYKEPTRKSPRMGPAVNYREQLPLLENKKSRRKVKVSESLLLARAVGVAAGRRLGGRLATTLVATKNVFAGGTRSPLQAVSECPRRR